MKNRIILFDLLRIFAIALVIGVHILQRLHLHGGGFIGWPGFYYVTLGGIGVTIFLILSGMVLEASYGGKKIELKSFFLKRAKRIYPIYWLSLIFSIIISLLNNGGFPKWKSLFLNFSGLQVYTGWEWIRFINNVSWFIGLIIVLYLFYPFITKLMDGKRKDIILIVLLVISVLSRYFLGKYWLNVYRPIDWFPLCRVFEFGLGIWLVKTLEIFNIIKNIHLPKLEKLVHFIAELSFPAFLIHASLLRYLSQPILVQISLFIIATLFVAWITLFLDNQIQKRLAFFSK